MDNTNVNNSKQDYSAYKGKLAVSIHFIINIIFSTCIHIYNIYINTLFRSLPQKIESFLYEMNKLNEDRKLLRSADLLMETPYELERLRAVNVPRSENIGMRKVIADLKRESGEVEGVERFSVFLPERYAREELMEQLPIDFMFGEFVMIYSGDMKLGKSSYSATPKLYFKKKSEIEETNMDFYTGNTSPQPIETKPTATVKARATPKAPQKRAATAAASARAKSAAAAAPKQLIQRKRKQPESIPVSPAEKRRYNLNRIIDPETDEDDLEIIECSPDNEHALMMDSACLEACELLGL